MEKINNQVFLNKIFQRIKNGDFDKYLTLPFMSKELLFSTIKTKIERKINTSGTPILNDAEIKDCIEETKITAVNTFGIFINQGFINKTESGFELTSLGHLAIKLAGKIV